MTITVQQLSSIMPLCRDPLKWATALNYHLSLHGIISREQTALFIAQVAHESGQFNIVEENLNYSAAGLLKIFSKYFDNTNVQTYARKPILIANKVYANRMGNGPEAGGDGWKFRGKGLIQLTGKDNHLRCSRDLFNDERFIQTPELLLESDMAMRSALWFWDKNNLSVITDIEVLTKKINGGLNGLEDRKKYYAKALTILS